MNQTTNMNFDYRINAAYIFYKNPSHFAIGSLAVCVNWGGITTASCELTYVFFIFSTIELCQIAHFHHFATA